MGFELTISAGERPQTYALDRAATGTGQFHSCMQEIRKQTKTLGTEKQMPLSGMFDTTDNRAYIFNAKSL